MFREKGCLALLRRTYRPLRVCSFVVPRHPSLLAKTGTLVFQRQALAELAALMQMPNFFSVPNHKSFEGWIRIRQRNEWLVNGNNEPERKIACEG
jgi:hypothetical protein